MAFKLERFVRFLIDYKNCNNSPTKGVMSFDFQKETVQFKDSEHTHASRGTFSMSDMREMIRVYDEEKARLHVPKSPEEIAAEQAKLLEEKQLREARNKRRRELAAAKKKKTKR